MPTKKLGARKMTRAQRSRINVKGGPLVGGRGVTALLRLATRGGSPVTGPSKTARMSSAAAGPSAMAAGRARRRRK